MGVDRRRAGVARRFIRKSATCRRFLQTNRGRTGRRHWSHSSYNNWRRVMQQQQQQQREMCMWEDLGRGLGKPRDLRSGGRVWRVTPARLGAARYCRARAASSAASAHHVRIPIPMPRPPTPFNSHRPPSTPPSSSSNITTTLPLSLAPQPPLFALQSAPASSLTRRPLLSLGASPAATFTSALVPPSASTLVSPSDSPSARETMSISLSARLWFHDLVQVASQSI